MIFGKNKAHLAIIGLGYVGLPLALEFAKNREVIGYDINEKRINELKNSFDKTLEVSSQELEKANNIKFTNNLLDTKDSKLFIVTVPTPIDENKKPNLNPLIEATKSVGKVLKKGDTVIFESTVYPGATEEICVPVLENQSKLLFNKEFNVGYSPERINPGDKNHKIQDIVKITSGSNEKSSKEIDDLYQEIITAGTYRASSIMVAEAAKVIENTQRDVNIGLVNELSLIFNKLGLDTEEVLEAAGTKWNFLPFRPGLVGGHCIGVDPYYLTHKAISIGYKPEMILAGRKINDSMPSYIVERLINELNSISKEIRGSEILVLGFTFKENCPDTRNTKVAEVITELNSLGSKVEILDPWIDSTEVQMQYGLSVIKNPKRGKYDAIIIAVAHDEFRDMSEEKIKDFGKENCIIYDLKSIFPKESSNLRL